MADNKGTANTAETSEKDRVKALKDTLFYKKENMGKTKPQEYADKAWAFADGYKKFLDNGKTERECAAEAVKFLTAKGFKPYNPGDRLTPGAKIFTVWREKTIAAAIIGKKPLSEGTRLAAAHIDSPRLDLKQVPLYEEGELALLKTHYYGGIKKYQWTALPLALHGVIVKKNGERVIVRIGEEPGDPVFCLTDLLPHLAQEQMKRESAKIVTGEELNILIGSLPFKADEGSELVKLNILDILNKKYGIIEADFLSAELEAVPAHKASDVGFDCSLIGGYGHDDRVCAYTSLAALAAVEAPEYTTVAALADKEEIGSTGATGLAGEWLEHFYTALAGSQNTSFTTVIENTLCLSADVCAAFDPTFPDVLDKRNAAFLNKGVAIMKYTGHGGKGGTNDASAETTGKVRAILDGAGISWQTCELGKVDLGGGGTVAMYISRYGAEVIDAGVPVLSMHSPFELVSKLDVYSAYEAFVALFNS